MNAYVEGRLEGETGEEERRGFVGLRDVLN